MTSRPQAEPAAIVPLTRAECIEALRRTHIGRVATTVGSERRPLVRPVTYQYDDPTGSVMFHSLPGTKLHALLERCDAAFEIDGESDGWLWSVIVRGRVETETRPQEIARLASGPQTPLPIAADGKWLRIRGEVITGVRFAVGQGV
jgi:nitroimidazol reductase NimA-like FMN-containing flavoprotein (pyridoxamine 5'-phosphate oxidase superfamily)